MGYLCLGGATTNMQALSTCDVDAARECLFNDMLAAQDTQDTPGEEDEPLELLRGDVPRPCATTSPVGCTPVTETTARAVGEGRGAATYDWQVWTARDSQLLPDGVWLLWLIVAGRGWGKTRTGSETERWWVEAHAASNYALVAPTAAMARDVLVEGESYESSALDAIRA